MLSLTQLKPGVVIDYKGAPHQVTAAEFSRSSQSGGFMRTRMRNLITGNTLEITFKDKDRLEEAAVEKSPAQYLYRAGDSFVFMNNETYDQMELTKDLLGDQTNFLKEGMEVVIQYYNDVPINVELPIKIVLEVIDTEPGYKGNTSTNVQKPAKLETGAEIKVPIFINPGDKVRIDTRTGEYLERA